MEVYATCGLHCALRIPAEQQGSLSCLSATAGDIGETSGVRGFPGALEDHRLVVHADHE